MLILCFKKLLFLLLVDFIAKIWLNNSCYMKCTRVEKYTSCFVYKLSYMIFCPKVAI